MSAWGHQESFDLLIDDGHARSLIAHVRQSTRSERSGKPLLLAGRIGTAWLLPLGVEPHDRAKRTLVHWNQLAQLAAANWEISAVR